MYATLISGLSLAHLGEIEQALKVLKKASKSD
jgi:ribosomal protein S21